MAKFAPSGGVSGGLGSHGAHDARIHVVKSEGDLGVRVKLGVERSHLRVNEGEVEIGLLDLGRGPKKGGDLLHTMLGSNKTRLEPSFEFVVIHPIGDATFLIPIAFKSFSMASCFFENLGG